MKITIIALLIIAFNAHAVKLTETTIQAVTIETEQSFLNEEEALEAAFKLEDKLHNYSSDEFGKLKTRCHDFIGLLKPTTVRLRMDKGQNIKGIIQVRIRCLR